MVSVVALHRVMGSLPFLQLSESTIQFVQLKPQVVGCELNTFQCPEGKPSVSVGVTLLMETYLLGLRRVSCDRHTDVTPDQNS